LFTRGEKKVLLDNESQYLNDLLHRRGRKKGLILICWRKKSKDCFISGGKREEGRFKKGGEGMGAADFGGAGSGLWGKKKGRDQQQHLSISKIERSEKRGKKKNAYHA